MGNNALANCSAMQMRELSTPQPPITARGRHTDIPGMSRLSPKDNLARSTESSQSPHQRLCQSLYLGLLLCSPRPNAEWGQPGQITKHFLQNAIVGIPSWAWAPPTTPHTQFPALQSSGPMPGRSPPFHLLLTALPSSGMKELPSAERD